MGIFLKYKRRNFIRKKKNNKEGWQGVLQEIQSGISKWLAIILVKNILYPKFVMISCCPPRPKLWNHCRANFETMISLEIVIWLVNLNLIPPCCSRLLPPSICPHLFMTILMKRGLHPYLFVISRATWTVDSLLCLSKNKSNDVIDLIWIL